jgi:3-methyladenine DNA glycosylase AlkC
MQHHWWLYINIPSTDYCVQKILTNFDAKSLMVIYKNGKTDNYQSANYSSDASRLLHPWAWKIYLVMKDTNKWEMHQFLVKTFIIFLDFDLVYSFFFIFTLK